MIQFIFPSLNRMKGITMKKILIVGKNSYIGRSLKNFLEKEPNTYCAEELETVDFDPTAHTFRGFDVIVCVAGIAHVKETKENAQLYYKVNRDLAVQIAKKAKAEGVGHFIFLSTMSVYGLERGVITPDTLPAPKNHYGRSKLQAENLLSELCDESFKLTIIRPPMVYGKNCKGNFQTVVNLACKLPVFPKVNNARSMIYIDNLCNFIKLCAVHSKAGIFCPQNKEYVNTSAMAKAIATQKNKKLFLSSVLGMAVSAAAPFNSRLRKAFGSLIYKDMDSDGFSYCVIDGESSFQRSV